MKLTRVEQLFDGSRLIFYYTAEGRVDFRELVRDLAAHFRTRIEMRQIGVRDEARMLGGYGSCGRPLCCTTWLQTFEPVSIKMAKQQNLSLNPSKLSGMCGRLKCCLRYELPNAKGVVHGGCGDEGGCGSCYNPTGPSGGCGSCGSGGVGRAGMTSNPNSQLPTPKHQIPTGMELGEQALRQLELLVGSWRLGVALGVGSWEWLELGAWDLGFDLKPRIGITVGDPAGIGPEIAIKAASHPDVLAICEPVLYGPSSAAELATVRRWGRCRPTPGRAPTTRSSRAVEDAQAGRIEAIATAPINKEAFAAAGLPVAGPHRAPRASHRRLARRDDVLRRGAAGDPRDGAHRAGGGAAHADRRAARIDRDADRRGAAAVRTAVAPGWRWPA